MPTSEHPILDPARRPVAGHRGNRAHAPENTLESFAQAVALGVDALEFDVRLTADGVAVVHHAPTVDRTTDGSGPVAAMTLAELRRLDAGARFTADGGRTFPWRGRGVRVPTLDEVLEEFADVPLLIELKTPLAQQAVHRAIERHAAAAHCVPASSFDAALEVCREAGLAYGGSAREISRLYFRTACRLAAPAARYALLAVPLRHRGLTVPTRRFLRAAHALGRPVHVWTVDDPAVARALWDRGAAGVVTNRPGLMVQARARG